MVGAFLASFGSWTNSRIHGITFSDNADHSHIIFKIDNPIEQKVFDINEDIKRGDLILDPFPVGHVCGNWISKGWVRHCHARSVVPNNPKNIAVRMMKGISVKVFNILSVILGQGIIMNYGMSNY